MRTCAWPLLSVCGCWVGGRERPYFDLDRRQKLDTGTDGVYCSCLLCGGSVGAVRMLGALGAVDGRCESATRLLRADAAGLGNGALNGRRGLDVPE